MYTRARGSLPAATGTSTRRTPMLPSFTGRPVVAGPAVDAAVGAHDRDRERERGQDALDEFPDASRCDRPPRVGPCPRYRLTQPNE